MRSAQPRLREFNSIVLCHVYASDKRRQTYVWLAARENPDVLPAVLAQRLGELRFVLEVQLDPARELPNANAAHVLQQLRAQGWYLQVPPDAVPPTGCWGTSD